MRQSRHEVLTVYITDVGVCLSGLVNPVIELDKEYISCQHWQ